MNNKESITINRDIPYPYSIDADELVNRYEKIYVSAIHDILSHKLKDFSLHMENTWLGPDIKCMTKDMKREVCAGFAFTIKWTSDPTDVREPLLGEKMLGSYFKNAILVVDTSGDTESGYLGELNTNAMMRNSVRASVIDGGARDSGFVKQMDFPVFCKFTSPIDAFSKYKLYGWQIPISINNVTIEPWDVIVGDSDGVIVVPKAVAEEVLVRGESRRDFEDKTRELIQSGKSPEEAGRIMGAKSL
ncbi:RraA family protein [Candidatus Latescibacterota bacterium]